MKLLVEAFDAESVNFLVEENEQGAKQYFIEGIFLQSDITNRNGRSYPKEIMQREVARYIKEFIDTNRAMGELGHPNDPSIVLDRVSHKIVSLKEDGGNYIGKAQILDTPYGKIVKNLKDGGIQLGVSSRGLGSIVERNGVKVVCEDFHLVTAADIVADPSAPDAFVTYLMENKEWVWENGFLIERETEIKKSINTMSKNKQLNSESLEKIFSYVLSNINK